jgi:hypothetical protein
MEYVSYFENSERDICGLTVTRGLSIIVLCEVVNTRPRALGTGGELVSNLETSNQISLNVSGKCNNNIIIVNCISVLHVKIRCLNCQIKPISTYRISLICRTHYLKMVCKIKIVKRTFFFS